MLNVCRAKAVPSFLSYFETLSTVPAPGIEPVTSRSAVKAHYPTEVILPPEEMLLTLSLCSSVIVHRAFLLYQVHPNRRTFCQNLSIIATPQARKIKR